VTEKKVIGRPSFSDKIQELEDKLDNKSFLVCPDCADKGETNSLYWVNADQLSFGDYVEVKAEATCKKCSSYWQMRLPQMTRSQPQNRFSNITAIS
tara:strand:- start:605 stop:892 length:288 start_codon:yes stop_codon:yes gene_type:complete